MVVKIQKPLIPSIWFLLAACCHPGISLEKQVRNRSLSLLEELQEEREFILTFGEALNIDEHSSLAWFDQNSSDSACDLEGIFCNDHGHVRVIDLSSYGLQGTLPTDFSRLTLLERLLLRNNEINGSLPKILPPSLIHLNVDKNSLQGSIPNFDFGPGQESSNLQRLILSGNDLSGDISEDVCKSIQLRDLNISRNRNLQGSLPSCLGGLSHLEGLQVYMSNLVGPLPDSLCQDDDQEGWCSRFQFCKDGYRVVDADEGGGVKCEACTGELSNVLDSPTCRWVSSDGNEAFQSNSPSQSPQGGIFGVVTTVSGILHPSSLPSPSPTPLASDSNSGSSPDTPSSTYPSVAQPFELFSASTPPSHQDLADTNEPTLDEIPSNDDPTDMTTSPYGDSSPGTSPQPVEQKDGYDSKISAYPTVVQGVDPAVSQVQDFKDTDTSKVSNTRFLRLFLPALVLMCFVGFVVAFLVFSERRRRDFYALSVLEESLSENESSASESASKEVTPAGVLGAAKKVYSSGPFIARPETIASNPRVRFLIDKEHSNSHESRNAAVQADIGDGQCVSGDDQERSRPRANMQQDYSDSDLVALYGDLIGASILGSGSSNSEYVYDWEESEYPPGYDSQKSLMSDSLKSTTSSSVSSTTPWLNQLHTNGNFNARQITPNCWDGISRRSSKKDEARSLSPTVKKHTNRSKARGEPVLMGWLPLCGMNCGPTSDDGPLLPSYSNGTKKNPPVDEVDVSNWAL